MTRVILLTASLICAAVATLIGFEIVHVDFGKAVLLTVAWGAWALALLIASELWVEYEAHRIRSRGR